MVGRAAIQGRVGGAVGSFREPTVFAFAGPEPAKEHEPFAKTSDLVEAGYEVVVNGRIGRVTSAGPIRVATTGVPLRTGAGRADHQVTVAPAVMDKGRLRRRLVPSHPTGPTGLHQGANHGPYRRSITFR